MNSCNFIGRLTKDPEAKSTANGKVFCNFSIAVDRGYKDAQGNKQVDFIPCTAWEATSNLITKYFHKGDLIGINGRLESNQYTDSQTGANKISYNVNVLSIDFIQGKKETKPEPTPSPAPVPTPPPVPPMDNQISYELPLEIEDEEPPFDI
jgi:single-strand DNA-binding protein